MRNFSKRTMFSLSSFLESRNCVRHLRTLLDLQRMKKEFDQTETGFNHYPGQRDKERRFPWCAEHRKTEVQREYHLAWNAWKRCCKKVDSQGEHFTGIHDRFLRDPVYRESQLAIGWSEKKCREWDELAQEDHTYKLTPK